MKHLNRDDEAISALNKQAMAPSFINLKPEQIAKTLFVISCSAGKSPRDEENERWRDTIHQERYSKFQEFASLHEQILKFYSTVESDVVAQNIYRGFKYQHPLRWKKAWEVNRDLPLSGISRAIHRYTGRLYENLGPTIRQCLAEGTLTNILIISALHGPTLPSDYLPYYDLTMGDFWRNKVKLKDKWPRWVRKLSGKRMRTFLSNFEEIHIMVGNEYKPTAMAIKEIMPNVKRWQEAQSFGSQSISMWGRELNRCLSMLIE